MAPNKKSMNIVSCKKGKKRKRIVLTLHQKIDICRRLEKGENRNILMREYNIGASTIYDIKAQKEQLFKFYAETESDNVIEKRKTLAKPKLEQLDAALYDWFQLKQSEGISVSGPMLIEKATDFYKKMNLTDQFAFSHGWLGRFKLRHGIRRIDLSSEPKSDEYKAAEKYCESFISLIKEYNLTAEQIYNADEIDLFWRCVPSSIQADSNTSSAVGVKCNKDRVTVVSCANAAGTHRLKLLVVGRYKLPLSLTDLTPLPVFYKNFSHIDKDVFYEWYHHNFVPDVKEHFKKIGLSEDSNAVLLLDKCGVHPDESELVSGNIFSTYMPTNVTSLVQPMCQGITQNMIFYYRRKFLRKLIKYHGTVESFQAKFNIKDALHTIHDAWWTVRNTTLKTAWKNLWPYVMFGDVSSDEEFEGFDIQPRKAVSLILDDINNAPSSNLISNLQEDDVKNWLDTGVNANGINAVSNAEIKESILNSKTPKVQEFCEENLDDGDISWDAAAHHLQKFISFAQKSSSYSSEELKHLHSIHLSFQKKKKESTEEVVENFLGFISACLMSSEHCEKSCQEIDKSSTSVAIS